MTVHRTAQGKQLDMGALAAKNELTRAIGNMKVNARGDHIDATGRVIKPVTEVVNDKYAKTVGNRSAQARSSGMVGPDSIKTSVDKQQLTQSERELEDSLAEDMFVENMKAAEKAKK